MTSDTQGFSAVDEFDQPGGMGGMSTNRLDSPGDFADFNPFGDDGDAEADFGYEFQQEAEQVRTRRQLFPLMELTRQLLMKENVLYTVRVEPRKSTPPNEVDARKNEEEDPFDELITERHKRTSEASEGTLEKDNEDRSARTEFKIAGSEEEPWVASFDVDEEEGPGGYADFAPFGGDTDDIVNVLPSTNSPLLSKLTSFASSVSQGGKSGSEDVHESSGSDHKKVNSASED